MGKKTHEQCYLIIPFDDLIFVLGRIYISKGSCDVQFESSGSGIQGITKWPFRDMIGGRG